MGAPGPAAGIDLDHAVFVLSGALDYVGVDEVQHGKRVAALALELAEVLGWPSEVRHTLGQAALLHDIGVSSTQAHGRLLRGLEVDGVAAHCERGAGLVRGVPTLAPLAPVVLHHHTRWDHLTDIDLGRPSAEMAALIFLCDRIDVVRARFGAEADTRLLLPVVREHSGTLFHPEHLDALDTLAGDGRIWDTLHPERVEAAVLARLGPGGQSRVSVAEVLPLATVFGHVVDAKSPYTARHSERVAALAAHLAGAAGLDAARATLVEVTGLVHDLGKLRVPDALLEKPGALDPDEQRVMHRHAWDSFEILDRIDGLGEVALWSGLHHQTLAGDGYPVELADHALPLEARIVAVADVLQALAADRPYRRGVDTRTIRALLRAEVASGHLAPEIVSLVESDFDTCYQVAIHPA